jgi:Family of unknown function (DUF5681)
MPGGVGGAGLRAPSIGVTGLSCLLPLPRPRPGDPDSGRLVIADDAQPVKSTRTNKGWANIRPWKPGQSGNPKGRPKSLSRAQDLARDYTETGIETLVRIMQRGRPDGARVSAAVAILDRAWGKPVQAVEHSGPEGERLFPAPAELDDAHLERMLQLARELRAAAHGNGHPAP